MATDRVAGGYTDVADLAKAMAENRRMREWMGEIVAGKVSQQDTLLVLLRFSQALLAMQRTRQRLSRAPSGRT